MTDIAIPTDWKSYPPGPLYTEASAHYQKRLYTGQEGKISINVYQYNLSGMIQYVLEVYIPDVLSPTGMSLKIQNFNYYEADWKEFEAHGRTIVRNLCPNLWFVE